MAKVSVIIPTYNREAFVVKAVDSVLKQSFKDYEMIVVDDGSTDGTRLALDPYRDKIQYIFQANGGASAARNTGVKSANGEWLAFLDSDDEWTAEYLSKQMDSAGEAPEICMQTANCLFIGLDGQTKSYFEINGSLGEFKGRDYLFLREPFRFVVKHGPWQVGSTIIRREAMEKAGLFDTSLPVSHDFDLMARVALQGAFGMIRESLVNIYRRDEAIECLTHQAYSNLLQAREMDDKMYENLRRIGTLSYKERKALNQVMAANRRAMGNLLFADGKWHEARSAYRDALMIDCSVRSLGKYFLSFLRKAPKPQASRVAPS